MEANFGGKPHHLYSPVVSELSAVGKRSLEWDLNDWKWDGDLFTATPLNSRPSDCRSRQLLPAAAEIPATTRLSNNSSSSLEEDNQGNDKGRRELEKRRRVVVVEADDANDEAGSLNLRLGGQDYPIIDGDAKSGKKTKIGETSSNRAVCQVDDCKADLSSAKDYHRRHKVCDTHSKASKAVVGNLMQRFCQQCSRFHVLQEFDEGKRSCRRRLAGHNKRRRKMHPDNVTNGGTLSDEKSSSYLLLSLLRILSNIHSNNSNQTKDQDLLSHILRSLASLAGSTNVRSESGLLQGPQRLENAGTSLGKLKNVISSGSETVRPLDAASNMDDCSSSPNHLRSTGQCGSIPASDLVHKRNNIADAPGGSVQGLSASLPAQLRSSLVARETEKEKAVGRVKMNNFDLNNIYDESLDHGENLYKTHSPKSTVNSGLHNSLWVHPETNKSSPPCSGQNSDTTSRESPSSSGGEAQSRTDRIVLKLFGKDPNDFPSDLRKQILDWLSHSPTDIESYIRPGCIILTVYLHLGKPAWEQLCFALGSKLTRLVDVSKDSFWRTGWVYARVRQSVAFIYNGQIVLDAILPIKGHKDCQISSIKPIAVPLSERVEFAVKGFNLHRSSTRLHCAIEGKYLVQESCYHILECVDTVNEHDGLQHLNFHCLIPNAVGRGFIEVEDHGLSGSFFPFIVAERDVCSEICCLEDVIEASDDHIDDQVKKMDTKNEALDFIHEMGWLLHRSQLKCRHSNMDPNSHLFPFRRFRWLMEFSMDHDWCAIVKKLLGILFDGIVDLGDHDCIELALLDMSLLHRAVERNCRPMVELLMTYIPDKAWDTTGSEQRQELGSGGYNGFIFKPDVPGPAGLTPLHMAASREGSEDVLDALTDDPGSVAIEAWRSARDSTGLTPNDYACLRGHYPYIHLIQRKSKKKSECGHVVLDIPGTLLDCYSKQKISDGSKSTKVASLQREKGETKSRQQCCKACEMRLVYGNRSVSLVYRPAVLSMLAIAAVCVCVALLFKSSPEVLYVFRPFRWELLKYGSI